MMLHFAQTAIALVVAGASVLIVGGLVRETLHEKGRHIHLFPDAHDPPEVPVATPAPAATAKDAGPFRHSRGENVRHDKRGRTRGDTVRDAEPQGRKKRQYKKRDHGEKHTGRRTIVAETEDS